MPRWIFDKDAPSVTASKDLDGDGGCSYASRLSSDDVLPPLTATWRSWCDGWTNDAVSAGRSAAFSGVYYMSSRHSAANGGNAKDVGLPKAMLLCMYKTSCHISVRVDSQRAGL